MSIYYCLFTLYYACMLYVFYGTDSDRAHAKAIDTLNSLRKKAPDATVSRLTGAGVTESSIAESLNEYGLFKSEIVLLVDVRDEGIDAAVAAAGVCAASSHVVLYSCGALTQKEKKSLAAHAKKMQEFEAKAKKPVSNLFSITDALYAKDAKRMILDIEKARMRGVAAEELLGVLFWGAKNMVLADAAQTAEGAGLKPFVFQKAKKGASMWGSDGSRALVAAIAHIPHESRSIGVDPYVLLEKYLL